MLVKKLSGKIQTEFPMPDFDSVDPSPAVKDMAHAKDRTGYLRRYRSEGQPGSHRSSSASKYGQYDIAGVMDLTEETYETAHGGYDPVYANEDADRVLPVDVISELDQGRKDRQPS
ncbi:MAG: glycine/betaine/sarcosine/D-proline family reductase selenoprotein B [Lachnoclostridium sp.]